jgi:hypothetical protein
MWLKTLSSAELLIEIQLQKESLSAIAANKKNQSTHQNKLLLIYSLPNPAVYQPYKAKTLLNNYPLTKNINNQNDTNLVFMVMLRDQLNSQLFLLDKQEKLIEQQHQTQKRHDQQAIEIVRLKKQIAQLKAIEKNINNHTSIK